MAWLLVVSLLWAFSFGLIKGRLTTVDPALVAFIRLGLALVVLLPFFRPRAIGASATLRLAAIGAVQFGLMYVCYNAAFRALEAYEVAALTIFTPVLVALFDGLLAGRTHWGVWLAAALAVAGAGIIVVNKPLATVSWSGVALVQGSNACFALGQVAWRRWKLARPEVRDAHVFAALYAGAMVATLPFGWRALGAVPQLTSSHWLTLIYLGIIASGIGFFLWNHGAARTRSGTLAVINNAKIPLSVACSVWVFGESADGFRLLVGSTAIVLAGGLAEWSGRRLATR